MAVWQPGESGNPAGRPAGAKSKVDLPVRTQREVLKRLEERTRRGDDGAVDALFLFMLKRL